MHLLSSLLFAFSSSCDNIIVGLSYGAKKVKIDLINNIVIALISGFGTILSMSFGKVFLRFIPEKYTSILGSSILILFGLYLLLNTLKESNAKNKNSNEKQEYVQEYQRYEDTLRYPEIIDINNSKSLEFKESIILGVVLCLNNIGLGLGAGITGLNIYVTSFSSTLFSLIFIPLGGYIGKKFFSNKLARYSEIISIAIIIILGIYELFI